MTLLKTTQQAQGAVLADDGIPLHFGDIPAEYTAANTAAALLDRSHEGRVRITGADRLEILHRISTNDVNALTVGQGAGTIFTKANARIIDRVEVYNRDAEALLLTSPGRGAVMARFLQRKIFFNDDAQLTDLTAQGVHFTLTGPKATEIVAGLGIPAAAQGNGADGNIAGVPVFVAQRKPLLAPYYSIVVFDAAQAADVWQALSAAVANVDGAPAGSLAYNMLRVASGQPAFGREITEDYLPLEVGLWDEVSFTKGCYTGQEIIARMESRHQLARVLVRLQLKTPVDAPTKLYLDDKAVGTLTSSAQTPDGTVHGLAVVKTAAATPSASLSTEDGTNTQVVDLAGTPPPERMLS